MERALVTTLPPGPRGALAQTLRYAFSPDAFVRDLGRRYGDPFTVPTPVGPVVVTGDPDGVRDLLSADGLSMEGFGAEYIAPFVGERSLMLSGGDRHVRDRRLLNPLFSGARLFALRRKMTTIAERHADRVPTGRPISIEPLTSAYSLDVILEAVLGVSDPDRARRIGDAIHAKIHRVSPALVFFPHLRRAPLGLGPWARYLDAERELDALLHAEIRERRAAGAPGDDVLSTMLAARDDEGRGLDDGHVRDHVLTLLIAGHETTAIALAWALYWLHRTPDVLARVVDELATSGDAFDLPLLDAVCRETLRLHPVAPEFMRRLLAPITLKGWRLPAGTGVAVALNLLHTRVELYPEPHAFRPERFLSRRFSRFEYAPFGGGTSVCIGAQFALAEMKAALAAWLGRLGLSPCSTDEIAPSRRGRNWVVGPSRDIRMVASRLGLSVAAARAFVVQVGVREASERLENAFGVASFMGLGFFVALLLLGAVALVLPRGERFRMRGSFIFFGLYLTCFVASVIVPDGATGRKPLAVASVFFLLLGIARAMFVLVVDGIFTARLGRPLPRIFRDILQTVVYTGVGIVTLRAAGVDPGSLLTTSALLTAVVGLSLQDTLGNLFAGLSIQAQRPFEVGDFVQYDTDAKLIGRVIEINWRATTLLTNDDVEVIIPNAAIARAAIRNFTKPTEASRRLIHVACPYEVSPRKVRETILAALDGIPDVQREPTPNVVVDGFGVAGIDYIVRYYTRNFLLRDVTDSTVRERIWYALRRANIAIPHPTSEVHVVSRREAPATNDADRLATTARLLRGVDFLAVLPPASLDRLVGLVETRVYGANETVIRQGDAGDELFVVGRGEVSVTVGRDGGSTAEIARLGPGQFFGEMSMMTGEARRATVSALGESDLLVVGRQAFAEVLSMSPELARMVADAVVKRQEHLGEHLAARAARAAAETAEHEAKTNALVDRVRQFLQLR